MRLGRPRVDGAERRVRVGLDDSERPRADARVESERRVDDERSLVVGRRRGARRQLELDGERPRPARRPADPQAGIDAADMDETTRPVLPRGREARTADAAGQRPPAPQSLST